MSDQKVLPITFVIPSRPLSTVKVHSDETVHGYLIINEADFDAAVHKLYAEKGADAPKTKKGE